MGRVGALAHVRLLGVAVAATIGVLVALPAASYATQFECTGTYTGQTLVGGVYVPIHRTCTLNGDTISGTITNKGTLNIDSTNTIGGSVNSDPGSQFFETGGSWSVGGSLSFDAISQASFGVVTVGGNFGVENTANFSVFGITVGGNVSFQNNGPIQFGGNTVGGNIYCNGNNPAPTNDGDPNSVSGKEFGQCAGLD